MTVLAASTELDAVNELLMRVSEAPVNNINSLPRVGHAALATIRQTSRNYQATGKPHYNTTLDVTLTPDVNGEIVLPNNVLFVDGTDTDVIYRDGKLYDRENKTFVFTEAVSVDMVLFLQWDELPAYCKRYFTATAKQVFLAGRPSEEWGRTDELELVRARAAYLEAEIDSAEYNILTNSLHISTITRRTR